MYLGKAPGERVATDFDLTELKLPQDIPLSLPSDLVRQRPDLRAAEAALHRASAEVGVATAQQLPQLTLSASYGSQSSDSGDMFNNPIWSVGAKPGGAAVPRRRLLRARQASAVASYDQALAQYKSTVLQSFQNVADSLRARWSPWTRRCCRRRYQAASSAAEEGLRWPDPRKQYELGVVSYMDVARRSKQQTTTAKAGLVQRAGRPATRTPPRWLLALGGGAGAEREAAQVQKHLANQFTHWNLRALTSGLECL